MHQSAKVTSGVSSNLLGIIFSGCFGPLIILSSDTEQAVTPQKVHLLQSVNKKFQLETVWATKPSF
jgi:hypothetical protein